MRIYRLLSSKNENDGRDANFNKLPKEIQKKWMDFLDEVEWVDVDYFGELFFREKGDLEASICACSDRYYRMLFELRDIANEGLDAYFRIDDITEEVIYSKHNMDDYGEYKERVHKYFDEYMINYVRKDHILDKINLYGIDSLTENDKRILRDEPYVKYSDTFIETK
jgi:hypothetical protein